MWVLDRIPYTEIIQVTERFYWIAWNQTVEDLHNKVQETCLGCSEKEYEKASPFKKSLSDICIVCEKNPYKVIDEIRNQIGLICDNCWRNPVCRLYQPYPNVCSWLNDFRDFIKNAILGNLENNLYEFNSDNFDDSIFKYLFYKWFTLNNIKKNNLSESELKKLKN